MARYIITVFTDDVAENPNKSVAAVLADLARAFDILHSDERFTDSAIVLYAPDEKPCGSIEYRDDPVQMKEGK